MEIERIGSGPKPPTDNYVVIEISQDGDVKYELDKDRGVLMVDRFLYTAMRYPFNYGFIPETLAEDGDPVDVLVLSARPIVPGAVIRVKPIGLLQMEDEAGVDEKILAVPVPKLDPVFASYDDITAVPEPLKAKIKHFFDHMKELEPGKWVKTKDWLGRREAETTIVAAIERYRQSKKEV